MDEGGRGRRSVEEGGGGWMRLDEGGGGWRSVEKGGGGGILNSLRLVFVEANCFY